MKVLVLLYHGDLVWILVWIFVVYRYSVPWVIEKNAFLTLNDDPKCFFKKGEGPAGRKVLGCVSECSRGAATCDRFILWLARRSSSLPPL